MSQLTMLNFSVWDLTVKFLGEIILAAIAILDVVRLSDSMGYSQNKGIALGAMPQEKRETRKWAFIPKLTRYTLPRIS